MRSSEEEGWKDQTSVPSTETGEVSMASMLTVLEPLFTKQTLRSVSSPAGAVVTTTSNPFTGFPPL